MARVMLVHQPVAGGVARHVSDLASGMRAAGHEVILCGPSPLAGAPGDHVELRMGRSVSPTGDAPAMRRLTALVGELAPDLVHAHSSKAGALARLARLLHPRVPVVYTPHGYAFAGHFKRESERRAYRLAERALAPLASRVIAVCEAEARLARGVGPPGRVRVVHNGVGPGGDRAPSGLGGPGAPVVCALTELRPGKGVENLLEAFARPAPELDHARLTVWGAGPDLEGLRARAAALGIAERVTFAGATADPLGAIASADVFVLPSLAEAFPYVVLEAMSVARPVVASDVGGVREALDCGRAGVLVAPGDVGALATALRSLLSDPNGARALAAAGAQRVRQRFGVEQMVQRTLAVYGELIPLRAGQPSRLPETE